MGTVSKLFRIFVEGETISDGRKITPEMIDQCVETFDPATYTPRINIEHISGYSPEPPFNGYGDVVAVEARDDNFTIAGKTEKRRALYAKVDGNDQLVKLSAADQKPFPSVELTGSYAGTGKVGLVGLAFTDTPASIGTERLKFSSRAPGTVFAYAKYDRGRWSVADPREAPVEPMAALPAAKDRLVARIVALDGTWHRPFTTLELAALQSLFDPGEVFDLEGGSDQLKREWIGNAVPSAAARGMAETIGETLLLATLGETFTLSSRAIWARPLALALAVDPRQPIDGIDAA